LYIEEGGAGGGGGAHHDACVTNSDCAVVAPVCCVISTHGPGLLCEEPDHHGGECPNGIPAETFTLIPNHLEVTNLVFRQVSSANSEGVKIEMTISNTVGTTNIDLVFYESVVLRGSY